MFSFHVFALFTISQRELPFVAHFISVNEIMNDKNIGSLDDEK